MVKELYLQCLQFPAMRKTLRLVRAKLQSIGRYTDPFYELKSIARQSKAALFLDIGCHHGDTHLLQPSHVILQKASRTRVWFGIKNQAARSNGIGKTRDNKPTFTLMSRTVSQLFDNCLCKHSYVWHWRSSILKVA